MYARMRPELEDGQPEVEKDDPPTRSQEKRAAIKNLLLVSTSIMLLFLASQSMDKLQSSVHFDGGLGTTALAVLNVLNFCASFCLTAPLIKRFGPKSVLQVSMLGFVAYIAVNFYATWYTLIPVAALNGLTTATLYSSLWTYIGTTGMKYSEASGLDQGIAYARFYSLIFMFIQSSSIWGNLISFEVLDHTVNGTVNVSEEACGAHFCDRNVSKNDVNFEEIPGNFYLLCGIFLGVSIAAVLLMMFVDRQEPKGSNSSSVLKSLVETSKKLQDPFMILVFPITIYGGLQLAFITGDYTKAYVTCAYGVADVGYVFICYGTVSTIFCLVSSYVVKLLGRRIVFILSTLLDIGVYSALCFHDYRGPHGLPLLFLLVGCLGITSSIWQAQVKAMYGSLFPDCQEVAFSLLGVFEALGIAVGYVYSFGVCTQPKLFILVSVLLLGMTCYGVIEVLQARTQRTSLPNTTQSIDIPQTSS